MARLLSLSSSSRSEGSITSRLLKEFVSEWKLVHPKDSVLELDLSKEKVPYLDEMLLSAIYADPQARAEDQKAAYKQVERYTEAITDSDVYVMAVPMYNFSVPAVFKAFIDLIVLPGVTFKMNGSAFEGLLKNKRAFVITASGGNYDQPPMSKMDFLEPYLRSVFGFLGVTDISFVKVQGHDAAIVAREQENALTKIREYVKRGSLTAVK